jgi:hypothetical protein
LDTNVVAPFNGYLLAACFASEYQNSHVPPNIGSYVRRHGTAADHVSGSPDERPEQCVFFGGQRHIILAQLHLPAATVERERADAEPLGQ